MKQVRSSSLHPYTYARAGSLGRCHRTFCCGLGCLHPAGEHGGARSPSARAPWRGCTLPGPPERCAGGAGMDPMLGTSAGRGAGFCGQLEDGSSRGHPCPAPAPQPRCSPSVLLCSCSAPVQEALLVVGTGRRQQAQRPCRKLSGIGGRQPLALAVVPPTPVSGSPGNSGCLELTPSVAGPVSVSWEAATGSVRASQVVWSHWVVFPPGFPCAAGRAHRTLLCSSRPCFCLAPCAPRCGSFFLPVARPVLSLPCRCWS